MGVNSLTFEQSAALLNLLRAEATGTNATSSVVDTKDFVSVATTTISAGYDPVLSALTQILGRTIFSDRRYTGKLGLLQVDNQKWGYITRKLQLSDIDWESEEQYALTDGQSVDMYVIRKPNVMQTNFYGQNIVERHYTVFKDQLDSAFTGPDEFSRFIGMVAGNCMDMIEQKRELTRRMTIANFMGGKIAASNGIIHALTEYNAETGQSLTSTTVMAPANYDPFVKWLYGRMQTLADMFAERSHLFQINVTGHVIERHTPARDLRVIMLSKWINDMKARVLSGTFNDGFLSLAGTEGIAFWQNINEPDEINVKPVYLNANGTLTEASAATNQAKIIACMFDWEAMGTTVMNEWSMATPMNAAGGYSNMYYHFTNRYWNDFTEKGVVIVLD